MSLIQSKQKILLWTLESMLFLMLINVGNTSSKESEMLSVQNTTQITCVTNDKDSPIFLYPPSTSNLETPVINLSSLTDSDWKLKNSQKLFYQPVTDKRWEEFPTYYAHQTCFEIKKHVTFSILNSPNIIQLFVDDDEFMEIIETTIKDEDKSWSHYHIKLEHNNVLFYMNNEVVASVTNFRPTNFCFKAKNATYYKLHDYNVWYSETISEKPTKLNEKTGCLLLYLSVCQNCFLSIHDINQNQTETIFYSAERDWQIKPINFSSHEQYYITREKKHQNETGYWAIDVRKCPRTENNKVFYSRKVENKEDTKKKKCYTLENKQNNNNNRRKRNAKSDLEQCLPGFLGKNCDVECSKLLGEKRKYCEEHVVCENDNCTCAWGYKGNSCEKPCDKGYWGFDCQRKCTEKECESCHHITGECTGNIIFIGLMGVAIIIIIIIITILICGGFYVKKLRTSKKTSVENGVSQEQEEPIIEKKNFSGNNKFNNNHINNNITCNS